MFHHAASSRHRPLTSLIAASVVAAFAAIGLQSAPSPVATPAQAADTPAYQDTTLPFEVRAADLVSRMTLAEKAQQLRATNPAFGGQAPGITRLGVRAYSYWNEALHGVARAGSSAPATSTPAGTAVGEATEFPTGLGLATSWNRDLVGTMAKTTSDEARGYYEDPINAASDRWGLTFWSPTINMHRDPRWGRAEETYGEDPYLTGQIGGQFVAGMQGDLEDNSGYLKSVTTPKHFLANNSENDRHSGSANLTEAELREYYTPAFATLMGEYGAASAMTSYNSVNGVPQSANSYALETLARRTWGFDGFVTSDCGAIDDVTDTHTGVANDGHAWAPAILGRAATRAEGTAWSLKAGTDVDCTGGQYSANLVPAINQGLLTENDVNVNLTRAFTVRMRLGEFDPTTPWSTYTIDNQISTAAHRAAAQASSDEGVVLLKNANGVLPLASTVDDVVLLGEFGQEIVHGDYSPTSVPADLAAKSVKAALDDKLGAANVTYASGTVVPVRPGIGTLTFYDAGGAVLGQAFPHDLVNTGSPTYSGYAPNIFDGTGWGFPGVYFSDLFATQGSALEGWVEFAITIPAGTQQISLLQYGEAPTPGGTFELSTNPGFGPYTPVATIPQNPTGGTGGWFPAPVATTTEPYTGAAGSVRLRVAYANTSSVGPQIGTGGAADPALSAAVAAADAVVVYVGTRTSDSAEEQDRASIALPRYQAELAAAACQANPNTVVYIQAVGEVDIRPFKDVCDAIVWSTYNGQDQGGTVPRILWGDANPSGKLPFTYYEDPVRDLEATVDYTMTPTDGRLGRTYQYFTGNVLYPFGYGLSYSTFAYSNLALSSSAVTPSDTITVSVDVTNTSSVPGKEVVEVYASSPKAGDLLRPDKQLKGFDKIALAANETKTVSIELKIADLWFWDEQREARTYDTGEWTIMAGPSSDTAAGLTATLAVTGTLAPALDVVTAVPDGTVLNTITPDNAIHANLSATRTDQSFYDLATVNVAYASSDAQVASVDATGAVRAVGAGVTQITASVTADGVTKSDTFPVVVYDGAFVAGDGTVLFDKAVAFPDQTITLADARDGAALGAHLAPATWGSDIAYSIAPMDTNTAGATVSTAGRLTAAKTGVVRVTAVASRDGKVYSSSATVSVVAASTAALSAALTSAEAINPAAYTSASAAALATAVQSARSVVANPAATQAQVDVAEAAVRNAIAGLVPAGQTDPLQALMDAAQALADSATVSAGQAAALRAAVEAAQRVLADSAGASQADVTAAIGAINAAIEAALARAGAGGGGGTPDTPATPDPAQPKAALASLVATLGASSPAGYTEASWAAVKTALDAARIVLANPNATVAQVGAAIQALAAATAALVPAPVTEPRLTPTLASVKAGQKSVTLVKGKAIKLAANGYLTDNSVNKVTWTSSKKSVATVSATGRIVAKKAGSARITAKVGGKSATIAVTVVAKKPAKSAVTSVKATVPSELAVGASADIAASYSPATATSVKVTYASSAAAVATVDSAGHLVAKTAGTATITVKAGSKSKAYTVTVK